MSDEEIELIGYLRTSIKAMEEINMQNFPELTKDNAGLDRMYPFFKRKPPSLDLNKTRDENEQKFYMLMLIRGLLQDAKHHEFPEQFFLCFEKRTKYIQFEIVAVVCHIRRSYAGA